jgi:hypothetical protein
LSGDHFCAARRRAVLTSRYGKRTPELWIFRKEAGTLGNIAHFARTEPKAPTSIGRDVAVLFNIAGQERASARQSFECDSGIGVFPVADDYVGASQNLAAQIGS